ncbi:thiamine pyrophosphate-binding protein [Streptomyces sp. NBC_01077]|uniref:thiamine pyrophosphate-binding protein n=1 Tax=Streptomyces sp. NBC_01077 TaxID=2903746 RepID=UPI0038673F05|nr:thiamine pyrophosphate-binding protein [Streptomyces sp. NBC_01077]WSV43613.1 thiamine pyrophosphate-binding protein [Streptomyces sp. NBC_01077]
MSTHPTKSPEPPGREADEPQSVAGFIVRALSEAGVTHVFGVPGGPLMPLYEALEDCPGIEPVLAKHEEGAAFMALGHAQVTGRLGVVCGTAGPGALHALTGVASATADGVPVLALTAQVSSSSFGRGGLQDSSGGSWGVDTVDVFRSATKLSALAATPAQVPRLLALSVRTAYLGRPGGVHISLPADVLSGYLEVATPLPDLRRPCIGPPDPSAVAKLVGAVRAAHRGVVLAGQGAKLSGAGSSLVRFAEALSWPVATTLKGKSVFPEDHALSAGVFGFGGGARAHETVLAPDVDALLVVGSALGELATHGWEPRLVKGRRLLRIDIDPLHAGAGFEADVHVSGDATAVMDALLAEVRCRPASTKPVITPPPPAAHASKDDVPLRASAVVTHMSRLLPRDTILFTDNGNCVSWLGQGFISRPPGAIHVSLNIASMGSSAGSAIGGKIAAGDRPVVALTGDAAFAMVGMEIHTAAELGLPVIWIVLNNAGNAMVHNLHQGLFGRSVSAMYGTPIDVATVARGLGAEAFSVHTLEQFDSALLKALASPLPSAIDVRVDPEEVPWALAGRIATLSAAFKRGESGNKREG